jgi:hypothetical protein
VLQQLLDAAVPDLFGLLLSVSSGELTACRQTCLESAGGAAQHGTRKEGMFVTWQTVTCKQCNRDAKCNARPPPDVKCACIQLGSLEQPGVRT